MSETKKIKVRLSPKIPIGSGFVDFISHTDLYPKKPNQVFEVEMTAFIRQKLATGELLLADDDKPSAPPPPDSKDLKDKDGAQGGGKKGEKAK